MKRVISLMALLALAVAAFAQTPEEILSRMEEEMSKHENEGLIMTADTKVPVLGLLSVKTFTLGDKIRMETTMKGITLLTWSDGTTEWTYHPKDNEITIKNASSSRKSSASGDAGLFEGIADGYKISIKEETDEAWHIECRRAFGLHDKNAPKSMEVVVAKGTYYPISLSAKMTGISMTMRDISFGVNEADVTFHPEDYPDATVKDKR